MCWWWLLVIVLELSGVIMLMPQSNRLVVVWLVASWSYLVICTTSLATMSFLAMFASCRCCSCSCRCCSCTVLGPGLPINGVSSLLINIRRAARFWIFQKQRYKRTGGACVLCKGRRPRGNREPAPKAPLGKHAIRGGKTKREDHSHRRGFLLKILKINTGVE